MVVEIRDDDVIIWVDGNEMWPREFARIAATGAEFLHKFPIGLKDEDAWSSIIHHHQMAGSIHSDTLWACKLIKLAFLRLKNFLLMSRSIWILSMFRFVLRTLPRLYRRIIEKRRVSGTDLKKEKKDVKVDFALVFDSLKIQSCRLTRFSW